jgi:hypothetical protein
VNSVARPAYSDAGDEHDQDACALRAQPLVVTGELENQVVLSARIAALTEPLQSEVDRLRQVCAEAYHLAAVIGAPGRSCLSRPTNASDRNRPDALNRDRVKRQAPAQPSFQITFARKIVRASMTRFSYRGSQRRFSVVVRALLVYSEATARAVDANADLADVRHTRLCSDRTTHRVSALF